LAAVAFRPTERSFGAMTACVVRIGDAVQDQQQRRAFHRIQQLIQVARQRQLAGEGDHALMAAGADDLVETLGIDRHHAHAMLLGVCDQVGHAAVVAAGVDEDLFHRLGLVAQPRGHRVEAENHFIFH
jgi:hypothetical protein